METFTFTCSICGEPSQNICIYCTKDACGNHLCDRCKKCSDCCECEAPLSHAMPSDSIESVAAPAASRLETHGQFEARTSSDIKRIDQIVDTIQISEF